MRLPIRVRLTAWYVLLLAAVIGGLGAFVVVRLRADLTADLDRSLRSAGEQVRANYERSGPSLLSSQSAGVIRVLPADSGLQLLTPAGRLVSVYGRDLPTASLLSPDRRHRVLAGRDVRSTARGPTDSEPFRVFATSVTRGRERAVLVLASSLEGIDGAVHRIFVLFLITGPIALAAIAAGGWWLARSALRPVARLTHQAERIEVDNLDERVPVPTPADEIARLAVTFNHMLDRLDRGVQEKRQLVADASHELRTPVAVMRSELDVALAYGDLQPEARAVLESTREEVERMTRTLENLLELARADDGQLALWRLILPLREVIDEVTADIAPVAAAKGVTVTTGGDGVVVEADRERVRQVIVNLVDNAVKYSRPGGVVHVETWRVNGDARLRVSDEGVGIAEAALPHVFERFYRVDSARVRDTGGAGLGLAICHEIAVAHGGRIWAESEIGRGSTFTLSLPAVEDGDPPGLTGPPPAAVAGY